MEIAKTACVMDVMSEVQSVLRREHDHPMSSIKCAIQLDFAQWEICVFNGLGCEHIVIAIIK
jgi:hypothetical protein